MLESLVYRDCSSYPGGQSMGRFAWDVPGPTHNMRVVGSSFYQEPWLVDQTWTVIAQFQNGGQHNCRFVLDWHLHWTMEQVGTIVVFVPNISMSMHVFEQGRLVRNQPREKLMEWRNLVVEELLQCNIGGLHFCLYETLGIESE